MSTHFDSTTIGRRYGVAFLFLAVLTGGLPLAWAADPAPKVLFDPAAADAAKLVTANGNSASEITYTIDGKGIEVNVPANGKSSFPGVVIEPKPAWDATGFGRLEATVSNLGEKPIRVTLRIDNPMVGQEERWSGNSATIPPGQSGTVATILGYRWGEANWKLKPENLIRATVFSGKSDVPQKFRIESLRAAGPAGETPPDPPKPVVKPLNMAVKPEGGVILGGKAAFDPAKQAVARAGAKVTASTTNSVTASFPATGEPTLLIKPAIGLWNLNEHLQVRVHVKNVGTAPVTPTLKLESRGGPTDPVAASAPLAPGGETDLVASFLPPKAWKGLETPEMLDGKGPKAEFNKAFEPGTGTPFTSNTTTGLVLTAGKEGGTLQVTSIVAEMPASKPLPSWLGKRPPVEGDWKLTFDDNFDGTTIDLHKWNIYSEGDWHLGKDTAWSKDNVIVKDGKLALRVEKRKASHNDNPNWSPQNYVTGNCDTYGKWTQRYGYFESRLKLPATPNSFTAFWMMPDRGLAYELAGKPAFGETRKLRRDSTNGNGMEFDIMEQLSIWGPNRHDFGMHWDFYMENHKSIGTFGCYFQPDAEGFITVGMLWEPGRVVMYQQGQESARWETKRISNIPSYFILQHITGGWETEGFDDSKLPADMIFDYVRAWQRSDLASEVDGPKPNDGGPRAPKAK